MSTITKERIEQYANDPRMCNVNDEIRQIARIALASLEAEAVITVGDDGGDALAYRRLIQTFAPGTKLYTAPPAPVSVPDFGALTKCIVQRLVDYGAADDDAIAIAEEFVYNACRAAMLQGAEQQNQQQNIPKNIPFEQWLSQQTGTIDVECGCVMTEVFFHWLRVAYEAGNSTLIPDGYCIMPLKLTAGNGAKSALSGEFHVQYRIVCQSCVGEGCEDCNHAGGWDAEIPVSWDTIKRIHEAAVEACALPAAPQQEVKP